MAQGEKQGAAGWQKCWEYSAEDLSGKPVASDNDNIYLSRLNGNVEAISRHGGERVWLAELGGSPASAVFPSQGVVYAATRPLGEDGSPSDEIVIRSLNKNSGLIGWTAKIPSKSDVFLNAENGILTVISESGAVYRMQGDTGAVLWQTALGAKLAAPPAFSGSGAIVGTDQGSLIAVSADGVPGVSQVKVGRIPSALGAAGGRAVFGDSLGNVVLYDLNSRKRLWRLKLGGGVSHVTYDDGRILAASLDNFVYLIAADNGNVVWKRRQPGRVVLGPLLNKEYAVVMAIGERSAVLIDRSNGKTRGQVTLPEGAEFVQSPVGSPDTIIFPLSTGLESYSSAGCGGQKETGRA